MSEEQKTIEETKVEEKNAQNLQNGDTKMSDDTAKATAEDSNKSAGDAIETDIGTKIDTSDIPAIDAVDVELQAPMAVPEVDIGSKMTTTSPSSCSTRDDLKAKIVDGKSVSNWFFFFLPNHSLGLLRVYLLEIL